MTAEAPVSARPRRARACLRPLERSIEKQTLDTNTHTMATDYSTSNALLAGLHHERRVRAAPPQQLQQLPASTIAAETAAATLRSDDVRHAPMASAPRVRSDAQRRHAQRLQDGKVMHPAANGGAGGGAGGGSSSAHVVSSDFLKHKQQAIKEYRTSYNRCADAHFSALRDPRQRAGAPVTNASSDQVASLAEEMAGRHLRPIKQFVASEATPPPQQRARPPPSATKPSGARRAAPARASSDQALPATDRLLRKYGL